MGVGGSLSSIENLNKFRRSIDLGALPFVEREMLLITCDERSFGGQGNLKEAGIVLIGKSLQCLRAEYPNGIVDNEIQDQVFLRNSEIFPEILSREHCGVFGENPIIDREGDVPGP